MYTTVKNIQDALGRSLTSQESDYFTNVLLPGIEGFINSQAGVTFGSTAEVSVYASGDGTSRLIIPTMSSVTKVEIDGTEVPTSTYRLYPAAAPYLAITKTSGEWAEGVDNYTVTGTLGYAEVPADITALATELAVNQLSSKRIDGSGVKSERVGDWSVTYESGASLSINSMATLDGYKRLSRSI